MAQMSQTDLRNYFEKCWQDKLDSAKQGADLEYSSTVEDAVLYPIYEQLLAKHHMTINEGRILDVGCGSGRWIRIFLSRFKPKLLMGIDLAQSSIDLLKNWHPANNGAQLQFQEADITDLSLDLKQNFDLINVANVLFHILEPDPFMIALTNLAYALAPGGYIITTEYLPRTAMRTGWMMVHSRDDFRKAVDAVGLEIVDIKGSCFFSNDPMGLNLSETATRESFGRVRNGIQQLLAASMTNETKQMLVTLFADIDKTLLEFCDKRISDEDLPSQKLVVLGHKTT
jgi:SAM-dependent methyltransferase